MTSIFIDPTSNARVRSLGYLRVDATDLDAWVRYASDLLGLQVANRTDDVVEFRMDQKEYRLAVRKADQDGLTAVGWEVGGPQELDAIVTRLTDSGYQVHPLDKADCKERRISGGVRFRDPDDIYDIELHYALQESFLAFSSPTGAEFVTGLGGLGHIFQFVQDEKTYHHLYFDLLGFTLSDYVDGGPNREVELKFLHCNPRHHSYAFGHVDGVAPAVGHVMFEVTKVDVVGRAWDKVLMRGAAPIVQTLGMHTNDKTISFYAGTPAGFAVEYGTGGILIDDATWTPTRYPGAHYWGHARQKKPSTTNT